MSNLFAPKDSPAFVCELIFWSAIGASLGLGFIWMRDAPLVADEGFHLPQISGFLSGNFEVSPHLTVLPLYHAAMAAILAAVGALTMADARLVSLLVSAMTIWVFYLIVARLWPEERYIRTARMAFLPILFPMHFVIYTDGWALLFVLLAVERCLAREFWQSAVAIAFASLIRQPNVVWVPLLWILANTDETTWRPRLPSILLCWWRNTAPFLTVMMGFAALFLLNRGVAVGDKSQHTLSFNLANLWFFSLCVAIFFLPEVLRVVEKSRRLSPRGKAVLAFVAAAALGMFFFTYHVSHQYNQPSLWFYLRNRVLHWTTEVEIVRIGVFFLAFLGLAVFCSTPFLQARFGWIVPIGLLSIVVMPLIEQRYYLVPIVLFLAFGRLSRAVWVVVAQAILAALLVYGISRNYFFL